MGNRVSETTPTGTTNYTYDAADELTAAGSTSYTYDANGNETAAGPRTFTYDLANRLASTSNGGTTTGFSYDGDGNRSQSIVGSQITKYVWDLNNSNPQLALERDGSNALLRRYVYGERRISMTTNGAAYYYTYDPVGSVANVTSATGATEWTYAYEPFGALRNETQNDPSAPTNVMKFAGELADATGQYYLRARQYDPDVGRFTTTDPLPPHGACVQSAYTYVANRPTVFVDPSGERELSSRQAKTCVYLASSKRQPPSSVKHDAARMEVMFWVRETAFGHLGTSFSLQKEYVIPGSGPNGGRGRADVALLFPGGDHPRQGYFWEIKADNNREKARGETQLSRYVAHAGNGMQGNRGYWTGMMGVPVRSTLGLILVTDLTRGLVVYRDATVKQGPSVEPCTEPQPHAWPWPEGVPGPAPLPRPLPELPLPVPA